MTPIRELKPTTTWRWEVSPVRPNIELLDHFEAHGLFPWRATPLRELKEVLMRVDP